MDRVVVTNPFCGLVAMQVCAVSDATDEEILEVCNRENPSGTHNGWASVIREAVEDDMFRKKENMPVKCKDNPDRLHFLVLC